MPNEKDWFEVIRHKDYLYVIRERLDEIDPRFLTTYTNIYLLIGPEKALLIDTGCGLYPIKPIIDELIDQCEVSVINTHSHFDHRGSNDEFDTIYIHENETKSASMPFDISFLIDSPKRIVSRYVDKGFTFQPPTNVVPLRDGDRFDLETISVEILYSPGHSIGAISLLTSNGELFTGDTAHYGAMYLPSKKEFPIIQNSIFKLRDLCDLDIVQEIYPSHEQYAVGRELLDELYDGIKNIANIWDTKTRNKFLRAWVLKDENFTYIV
ncbi:MAG: MBL fold metallo-hydrolase [Candidatus Hermodarchaeota archaeon]